MTFFRAEAVRTVNRRGVVAKFNRLTSRKARSMTNDLALRTEVQYVED